MFGRNRGYKNKSFDFREIETEDIWLAVLVLGRVGIEDI